MAGRRIERKRASPRAGLLACSYPYLACPHGMLPLRNARERGLAYSICNHGGEPRALIDFWDIIPHGRLRLAGICPGAPRPLALLAAASNMLAMVARGAFGGRGGSCPAI